MLDGVKVDVLEQDLRKLIQQRNALNRNPPNLLAKTEGFEDASTRRPLLAEDLEDYLTHLQSHFRTAPPSPEHVPEVDHLEQ